MQIKKMKLKEGLKFLFSKNLSVAHRYALQAIEACNDKSEHIHQEMVAINYLPILQRVTDVYGQGTWSQEEETGELVFTTEEESAA